MENETFDNLESPNQEETTPDVEAGLPEDPIEVEPVDQETDEADLKRQIDELKQHQQELYEQNRKLKGFVRDKDGKWVKKEALPTYKPETTTPKGITLDEVYTLVKANVPGEDKDEAVLYARSHNLSVEEALKTPELKSVLKIRADYRKSAEATNMSGSRKGTLKPTHDQIINDANAGKITDVDALVEARMQKKLNELKRG